MENRDRKLDALHNQLMKVDAAVIGLWTACTRTQPSQEMTQAYETLVERFATAVSTLDTTIPGGCPDAGTR